MSPSHSLGQVLVGGVVQLSVTVLFGFTVAVRLVIGGQAELPLKIVMSSNAK